MGCIKNIKMDLFPKQGQDLNKKVEVCFHYDTSKTIGGVIVRQDTEEPYVEIIKLNDGRHVLTTECQYTISKDEPIC